MEKSGHRRWLPGLGIVVLVVLAGLARPPAGARAAEAPHVLYEQDFARDPTLAARTHDSVALELEPGQSGQWRRENLARYELAAGPHTFCLDDDDPVLTELRLEDPQGRPVLHLQRPPRPGPKKGDPQAHGHPQCARRTLPSGRYTLRVVHDGRLITAGRRVAFTQALPASPPLVDTNGKPVGGWWALRPDPALDPQGREGRVAIPPVPANGWATTGAMITARWGHTATLLPSGEVLVAGGNGGGGSLASAELYNPATGQWTAAGAMGTARFNHTATLLPSGEVLVAGGRNVGFGLASAELYDPATGQWTAAGAMGTGRYFHTATLMRSGQVLVAGGIEGGSLASAELYSPTTRQWTAARAMITARYFHTATLSPCEDVVVVAGGLALAPPPDGPLRNNELYADTPADMWFGYGAMITARFNHTATLLPSGEVLVAGGEDTGLDPLAGAEIVFASSCGPSPQVPIGAMATARHHHTATLLPTGQVLVAGGNGGGDLASAELYDPATGQWTAAGALGTARSSHTATLMRSGQVLVAGGIEVENSLASAELYEGLPPLLADFTATQIDDTALFGFTDPTQPAVFAGGLPLDLAPLDPSGALDLVPLDTSGAWLGFARNLAPRTASFFTTTPLVVTDRGQYQAYLGVRRPDGTLANFFLRDTAFLLQYTGTAAAPAPASVTVLFRFFPDGTQLGTLQEGEVALFPQCNYQGPAAVFALDTPNLAALSSSVVRLDQIGSIKLGNNTGMVLYPEAGYQGTGQIVEADTPCLTTPAASFQVKPLAPTLLVSSKACQKCRLEGIDLSGYDLSGYDLSGAVLQGAILDFADLDGANLLGAHLNKSPITLAAASLEGAFLRNANLAQANLSGAILTDANFYSTLCIGSGGCQCPPAGWSPATCASAVGATMTGTIFGGAYLSGVDLSSATPQGAQFGGAVLVGVNFTGANLSEDPNGTRTAFTGAFLQGVNFGNANVADADFTSAYVDVTSAEGATMAFLLGSSHTKFTGYWQTPGTPPCVQVTYNASTTLPSIASGNICPDGHLGQGSNGACTPTQWQSPSTPISQAQPPSSVCQPGGCQCTLEGSAIPVDLQWLFKLD